MANCEACIHAYDNNVSPQARPHVSEPPMDDMILSHGQNPCAYDLGALIERTADVHENYGHIMSNCGEFIGNEEIEVSDPSHKVQLMMDCARYLAVLNQTLSGFIVPLRHEAPRFLSYRANPVARNQQRR